MRIKVQMYQSVSRQNIYILEQKKDLKSVTLLFKELEKNLMKPMKIEERE